MDAIAVGAADDVVVGGVIVVVIIDVAVQANESTFFHLKPFPPSFFSLFPFKLIFLRLQTDVYDCRFYLHKIIFFLNFDMAFFLRHTKIQFRHTMPQ